jgi:hypothetical protein
MPHRVGQHLRGGAEGAGINRWLQTCRICNCQLPARAPAQAASFATLGGQILAGRCTPRRRRHQLRALSFWAAAHLWCRVRQAAQRAIGIAVDLLALAAGRNEVDRGRVVDLGDAWNVWLKSRLRSRRICCLTPRMFEHPLVEAAQVQVHDPGVPTMLHKGR